MVRLEEVEDEEFNKVQMGEKDFNDDDDFTDTESSISTDSFNLAAAPSETLTDRILALRDIIPPSTRRKLTSTISTFQSYAWYSLTLGGKAAWVVSTSALLVGIPFALALVEEQQLVEMEKEQRMREMGQEFLTPGAGAGSAQQGKPAL